MPLKKNPTPYEAAEYYYSYNAFINDITDEEQLQKYREFAKKYSYDMEAVIDANTKAHELEISIAKENERIRLEEVKSFENKIDSFKKSNDEWIDYMLSTGQAGYTEAISYYDDEMAQYLSMISEFTASGIMNDEELEEMWADYYSAERKARIEQYKLSQQAFAEEKAAADAQNADSLEYLADMSYSNYWQNDDPIYAYTRVKQRNLENVLKGLMTFDEYSQFMSEAGSAMYTERLADSYNWLEYETVTGGLTEEEYIAGLERMKKYTQEYYDEGIISYREYSDSMRELEMQQFEKFDEILDRRKAEISSVNSEYSLKIQAVKDRYTENTLNSDIADTARHISMYKNAVTQRGRDYYEQLLDEMERLQYEKEIFYLEQEQAAEIASINEKYDAIESNKSALLSSIALTSANISSLLSSIGGIISSSVTSVNNQNIDNSSRTVNVTAADGVSLNSILYKTLSLF